METLKQQAIKAISELPDSSSLDDIMYELYVIGKINKGRESLKNGEIYSTDDIKRKAQSW